MELHKRSESEEVEHWSWDPVTTVCGGVPLGSRVGVLAGMSLPTVHLARGVLLGAYRPTVEGKEEQGHSLLRAL